MNKIVKKEWSNLPADLLLLVCENLNIPELISFSSVCTQWREVAATAKHLGRIGHQHPWLMLTTEEAPCSAQLYSLSNNKLYTIHNQPDLPIANRIIYGSAHGWLITADERSELSLLNPVTRQQIELPPVSTFENVSKKDVSEKITEDDCWRDECGYITHYTGERLRYMLYDQATLSSSPTSGDYTVVVSLYGPYGFALARAGDKKWTMIDHSMMIYDFAFHEDGKLYTTDSCSTVATWDFGLGREDLNLVEPEFVCWLQQDSYDLDVCLYVVRAPWGELLLVQRDRGPCSLRPNNDCKPTRRVDIWRVESEGIGSKLTELKCLGNYALFLGGNISTCISCEDNPKLQANCVYLADEWIKKGRTPDVCIFNLEDESIQPVLPNDLRMIWPPPIWITPSFA